MGHPDDARDRGNITDEVIVQFFKQRRVDRRGGPDHEERVAICRCSYDRLNAHIAAAPWAILNEELLTEAFLQPLPYQACGEVVHRTGREGGVNTNVPRGIV